MSDYHNQIFQRHLIFMRELESIKSKLPSETYYALEGGFKDMCQLAEILADELLKAQGAKEHTLDGMIITLRKNPIDD